VEVLELVVLGVLVGLAVMRLVVVVEDIHGASAV
jgi:hypothetical protein